jgi:hypothetical protein
VAAHAAGAALPPGPGAGPAALEVQAAPPRAAAVGAQRPALLRRGRLGDATIAAPPRAATWEERLELRRASGRKGGLHGAAPGRGARARGGGALLDALCAIPGPGGGSGGSRGG